MKKTKSVLQSALLGCALGFTGSGVNASVINVSLDVNDWVADPLHAAYQSPNQSKVATQEGLKVTNNGLRGPSGGQGAFVRTASTYNAQDAVVRYKWKAIDDIGVASYANYWNGFDLWTFGAQMTTTWSWAGSTVIPLDTWIYTEANVASDLSYYFNFSTSGYSDQGGFRSFTGVTNQAFYDSLASVHLKSAVNDNYSHGAGFVINEMSLEVADGPGLGTVPEPASILLFCTGLASLARLIFRVRKK